MKSKRPALPKASEEMQRWSALLMEEMKRWPETRFSRMFGMVSVYRDDVIFALLPGTRALNKPNEMATKLSHPAKTEGGKWRSFAVQKEDDLKAALEELDMAYQAAKR